MFIIDLKNKKMFIIICLFPVLLFIFLVSLLSIKLPFSYLFSDKVWHCLDYTVLSFVIAIACNERIYSVLRIMLFVIILATLTGALIELLQMFTTHRIFEYNDIFANFCGSIIGAIMYFILRFIKVFCKNNNGQY